MKAALPTVSAISFLTTAVTAALPPNSPIYIGEITTPSSTSQIAWLSSPKFSTKDIAILSSTPFSLQLPAPRTGSYQPENITNLEFSGYSSPAAALTKDGKAYANCAIGPDSVQLHDSPDKDGEHVWRTWTCWVRDLDDDALSENDTLGGEEDEEEAVKPMNNIAEPPPQFAGQGGVYQRWTCDETGCKPQE